jgi:hypothetical protein
MYEFSDSDSDDGDRRACFAPIASLSDVLVFEIGNTSCPGDVLLQRIIKREVTSICVPPPRTWGGSAEYKGWLFLKVAEEGVVDVLTLDYVTVAVQAMSIVRNPPGYPCTCDFTHQLTFGEVRKFGPTRAAYTAGTGPYRLPNGDEAIALRSRIGNARVVESKENAKARYDAKRPMVLNKYGFLQATTQRVEGEVGKGTRREARELAKNVKRGKDMVGVAFESRRKRALGVGPEVCCQALNCSSTFGVTEDDAPGVDRVVYFRNWFQRLSENLRREFISRRNRYVPAGAGKPMKRVWLLESPLELQRFVRTSTDPEIEVGFKELVPVCQSP